MDFADLKEKMEKRGMAACCFASRQELEEVLAEEVREARTIGFGGSMTLWELGLYDIFLKMGKQVYWHWKAEPDQRMAVLQRAGGADVYFSGSNAVTEDGRLVNIDGNGNRVSAMAFGSPKRIIIVGKNKICKDLDAAIHRIKTVACPQNARRLKLNTPCVTADCPDCKTSDRMCNFILITEGCPSMTQMKVYFLDEVLGF